MASPLTAIERHLVEQLLSPAASTQHSSGDVSHAELRPFVSEISRISRSYTGHEVGETLAQPVGSLLAAEAYALYYLPINAAKVAHLAPLVQSPKRCLKVLDFGSGPGTAPLALLATIPNNLEVVCVERSAPMRAVAERLLKSWKGSTSLSSLTLTPSLPQDGELFDIIIAANSLAELGQKDADVLLKRLLALLGPQGFLIMLEPGQPKHTRRLMEIRDTLIEDLTPLFPCTRSTLCPMLASSETDWCHGSLTWSQPPLSRQLDSLLGFNKHRIKYSAFVFQRGAELKPGVRVIVPAERTRRGIEITVCGEDFYGPVRIKKGQRSDDTRALEKSAVFGRVELSEPPQAELSQSVVTTSSEL